MAKKEWQARLDEVLTTVRLHPLSTELPEAPAQCAERLRARLELIPERFREEISEAAAVGVGFFARAVSSKPVRDWVRAVLVTRMVARATPSGKWVPSQVAGRWADDATDRAQLGARTAAQLQTTWRGAYRALLTLGAAPPGRERPLLAALDFVELQSPNRKALVDQLAVGINVLPERIRELVATVVAAALPASFQGSEAVYGWTRAILLARAVIHAASRTVWPDTFTAASFNLSSDALLAQSAAVLEQAFVTACTGLAGVQQLDRDVVYLAGRGDQDLENLSRDMAGDRQWNAHIHDQVALPRSGALARGSPARTVFLVAHGHETLPIFTGKDDTTWSAADMADQLEQHGLNRRQRTLVLCTCYGALSTNTVEGLRQVKGALGELRAARATPEVTAFLNVRQDQFRRLVKPLEKQLPALEMAYRDAVANSSKDDAAPGRARKAKEAVEAEIAETRKKIAEATPQAFVTAFEKVMATTKGKNPVKYDGGPDQVKPLGQQLSDELATRGYDRLRVVGFLGPVYGRLNVHTLCVARGPMDLVPATSRAVVWERGETVAKTTIGDVTI